MRALSNFVLLFICFFTILLHSRSAPAEENAPPRKPGETVINLTATEHQKMTQDLLSASLRMEVKGRDARTLQDKVNKAMQAALVTAKKYGSITVSTGPYYVYPFTPDAKSTDTSKYIASQTIDLQGKKSDDVLAAAGAIQDMGFLMNNLGYTLSPEKADAIQDELMERALKKIQASAERAAKALGKGSAEIQEVSANGQVPYYPMARGMMAMADTAEAKSIQAPVAEAGETDVTYNVNARVLLKP